MKRTKYEPSEWSYDCPHCGKTQGWTDFPEDRDDEESWCNVCKKEFIVEGLEWIK